MRVYGEKKESRHRGRNKKRHQGVNFLLKIYYMFKKYCRYTRLTAITDDTPSLSRPL